MVVGLGLVARIQWWVVSVVVLCGATTLGGGFDSGGCWVGILVVGGGGCL